MKLTFYQEKVKSLHRHDQEITPLFVHQELRIFFFGGGRGEAMQIIGDFCQMFYFFKSVLQPYLENFQNVQSNTLA